jgi:membrane-bound lytic murein transglycosylase B
MMSIPEAHLLPVKDKTTVISAFWSSLLVLLSIFLTLAPSAGANWRPLTERLIADGFDEQRVSMLFARPEVKFEPSTMADKISILVKRHQEGPSVAGPLDHNDVHRRFLNHRSIAKARTYLRENRNILKEVSAGYCVPPEIVVSILLVETRLGSNTGRSIVFNRLASMASCTDIEIIRPYLSRPLASSDEEYARRVCRQKADWAYNELKALLNYAGDRDMDPLGIRGSIYGAIGLCQFMPSNIYSYGVDADNDGRVDPFTTNDAIHSIANYLNKHGWQCNIDRDGKRKAVFAYNNSTVYVNTILAVADRIRGGKRSEK